MSKVLVDRELLEQLQEKLDPHRDAVLWGDVCDALRRARPAEAEGVDLHDQIMNLRCDAEKCPVAGVGAELSYKAGHRDARHAAAVLASEALAALSAVTAERDAANSRLHEVAVACATAEQERDQLRAEVERLRNELAGKPLVC